MNEKTESQNSFSHPILFFAAGAIAGAAAAVLLLPETRERARSLVRKTVEDIRDGEIRTEFADKEQKTKKAMKAGWEAFVSTLAQDHELEPPTSPEE